MQVAFVDKDFTDGKHSQLHILLCAWEDMAEVFFVISCELKADLCTGDNDVSEACPVSLAQRAAIEASKRRRNTRRGH